MELEIENREQTFNMIYKKTPSVGRLDPLAPASSRSSSASKSRPQPPEKPQAVHAIKLGGVRRNTTVPLLPLSPKTARQTQAGDDIGTGVGTSGSASDRRTQPP
jgi:hypothetical protein